MKSRLKMTMPKRKEKSVKWFRYILSIVLVYVIAAALIGNKQGSSNPEQQSRAAQGKISMKKDESEWKAYHITLSFQPID